MSEEETLSRAIALFQAGRLDEAARLTAELSVISPKDPEILHLTGVIAMQLKSLDEAAEKIKSAIELNPSNPHYHNSLGLVFREKKQYKKAVIEHNKAIELDPSVADFYNNAGVSCEEGGDNDSALAFYRQALEKNPYFAKAYMNIGVVETKLGYIENAISSLEKAYSLNPADIQIMHNLSMAYRKYMQYEKALPLAEKVLALQPDFYEGEINLAETAYYYGDFARAEKLYFDLIKKYPDKPAIKIQHALLVPSIAKSWDHIKQIRAGIKKEVAALANSNIKIENIEKEPITLPFYHSYHGVNNKEIMAKISAMFRKIAPDISYVAEHAKKPISKDKKVLNIGFVSKFFFTHTISTFYGELIRTIAGRDDFNVTVFSTGGKRDSVSETFIKTTNYIDLPHDLKKARNMIEAEKIDILVYPEIGMDIFIYFLAHSRLAPVQCVISGGHPATSGVSTIDYGLTSVLAEPKDVENHYVEKPVLLSHSTSIYPAPDVPKKPKTRKELGLPENANLYLCPAMLFRIHPDMDIAFRKILEQDPKANIILIDSEVNNLWKKHLVERLDAYIPANFRNRIKFIPFAKGDDFFHVLMAADVILDLFHFSLGATVFKIFQSGLPLVTWPGEFMRGRITYLYFNKMQIFATVAKDIDDYVKIALRLANDSDFKENVKAKIKAKTHLLFEDYKIADEICDFFHSLQK